MWIEIFKTGKQTDSKGKQETYSREDLCSIADKYNANSQDRAFQAPVVIGHPDTDDPAMGWVEKLAIRGDRLLAKLTKMDCNFLQDLTKGRFRKVSIALNSDNTLRHVGFLGAAQPAVKGLSTDFYIEDERNYSEFEANFYSEKDYQDLLNVNNDIIKELEEIKLYQKENEIKAYISNLSKTNKVINDNSREILQDLLLKVNRSESGNAGLIEDIKKFVDSIRFVQLLNPIKYQTTDRNEFDGRNVSEEKLELHRKAKQIQNNSSNISYEQALRIAQK